MRHPLWLLNSSLIILLFLTVIIILLTQQKTPRWASIEPTPYSQAVKREVSAIEMAKIYDNDLFSTYSKPVERIVQPPLEQQLPLPPTPVQVRMPQPVVPHFLEPLPISLKGVIMTGDDQTNRAIVANNKTKVESSIKIGDKVEDSQLIRIMKNRAIFIRSNGQEETFYLREKDAKENPGALTPERWETVIKKVGEYKFEVDPEAFVELVPHLGEFITSLDLLTVYQKGNPLGVRVGTMEQASFGHEFGLQTGDIITNINGIDVTNIKNRMKIYNEITSLQLNSLIQVTVMRHNAPIQIQIRLKELAVPSKITLGAPARAIRALPKTEEDLEEERLKILHEKEQFAPTLEEIKKREKGRILREVIHTEQLEEAKRRPVNLEI